MEEKYRDYDSKMASITSEIEKLKQMNKNQTEMIDKYQKDNEKMAK